MQLYPKNIIKQNLQQPKTDVECPTCKQRKCI